ncbi:hypothetical protein OU426_04495 [Frigidibacter sp. RF13]|uniref:hypothetical protein n=1 Tax=Frigidibacter sp. RF13 TaxID=2997340 RepID=UPI002271C703|nr:hypothetical protein [Frigidibacter sp. RF13]MCY1126105.1 hypothetical protein [Frigidibacter sp. RF13]
MSDRDLHFLLARLTPNAPIDLDGTSDKAQAVRGLDHRSTEASRAPSARIWTRTSPARPVLGIRVTAPLPDPASTAARITAAAIERDLTPVILCALPYSGLEPFGFRVERLSPGAAADQALEEAELVRFWDMVMVIDAADMADLG